MLRNTSIGLIAGIGCIVAITTDFEGTIFFAGQQESAADEGTHNAKPDSTRATYCFVIFYPLPGTDDRRILPLFQPLAG